MGRDVTSQESVLDALRTSENRYRSLVQNTSDWVWEMDMDRRHVFSNHQLEKILGYSEAELREIPFNELIHPDDLVAVNERLLPIIEEKRGWQGWVTRFLHKNGSARYLSSTASPVLDANGEMKGFRGVDRDITYQVLLAEVSSDLVKADSEIIDERIEDALQKIVLSYSLDRATLWLVKEGKNLFRRSHEWAREGLRGPTDTILIDKIAPRSGQLARAGQVMKFENLEELLPGNPADHAFFKAQGIKSMMLIPLIVDETLIGAGTFTATQQPRSWPDDTERELRLFVDSLANAHAHSEAVKVISRSESDLAQSEKLAHVGSYSFLPDSDLNVFPPSGETLFSRECAALIGCQADELSIELFLSRIHNDDRERVLKSLREFIDGGSTLIQEYRIVKPDGTILHVTDHTEADRGRDGKLLKFHSAIQDVTDRVLREAELRDALSEIGKLKEQLEEENVQLRQEVRTVTGFDQMVGDSPALKQCLEKVMTIAPTDIPVLILGETGTGKELIARAIHERSPRRDQRMVSVNCAALAANLVASELFGHEKGAFTGAESKRLGRFELADGGTLFLDEIGELAQDLQSKVLRVLQEGEFERLGGTKTLNVDVRLITATNRDLGNAVEQHRFRADLYYRINTFPIEVPALSERREDIPLLAEHFVRKHASRIGRDVKAISAPLLRHLQERPWPGNVRELEGFIVRALVTNAGPVLAFEEQYGRTPEVRADPVPRAAVETGTLRHTERSHIIEILNQANWVIEGQRGAAKLIGMAPSTLRSKMKQLGIKRAR